MYSHGIVSVRYATERTGPDAPVTCVKEDGSVVAALASSDVDMGGVKAFLAEGGTIEPFQPTVTSSGLKDEARRRILEVLTDPEGDTQDIGRIKAAFQTMRAHPPSDYRDDKHWT